MCTFSLNTLIIRLAFATALGCASAVTQAQLITGFPEFFQKHFRVEATDAQDGPKLRSQFDYTADGTLITSNLVKINNDGFEDHMALGFVQNFGSTRTRVTYNFHRFNYSSLENQSNDVIFDFRYRALRLQHRLEDTAQVSTIRLPLDFSVAHIDLSFSQTHQKDTAENTDEYRLVSRLKHLKFSAAWKKDLSNETWSDFSTEYRPLASWLMKYTYRDHGVDMLRQFRSEYATEGYRLAGEYNSQISEGEPAHSGGAIDIEKDTKLAALKLRLEYDEDINSPSVFLKVESRFAF